MKDSWMSKDLYVKWHLSVDYHAKEEPEKVHKRQTESVCGECSPPCWKHTGTNTPPLTTRTFPKELTRLRGSSICRQLRARCSEDQNLTKKKEWCSLARVWRSLFWPSLGRSPKQANAYGSFFLYFHLNIHYQKIQLPKIAPRVFTSELWIFTL